MLLSPVHQLYPPLDPLLAHLVVTIGLTKNHMEAPRAFAVYRYIAGACESQLISSVYRIEGPSD